MKYCLCEVQGEQVSASQLRPPRDFMLQIGPSFATATVLGRQVFDHSYHCQDWQYCICSGPLRGGRADDAMQSKKTGDSRLGSTWERLAPSIALPVITQQPTKSAQTELFP